VYAAAESGLSRTAIIERPTPERRSFATIRNYDPDLLQIIADDVLTRLQKGDPTCPVEVAGTSLEVADLAFQVAGSDRLELVNRGQSPARAVLLGGPPFPEQLLMWWNFVGRSHEDIVLYRQMWQDHDDRFGAVEGYRGAVSRLPAPPLPNATLRPRPNPEV